MSKPIPIRISPDTMRRLRIKSAELGLHQGEVIALALGALDSGWISVKDRLPGVETWALVHCEFGCQVDLFVPDVGWEAHQNHCVTHWQPLPEPPKED